MRTIAAAAALVIAVATSACTAADSGVTGNNGGDPQVSTPEPTIDMSDGSGGDLQSDESSRPPPTSETVGEVPALAAEIVASGLNQPTAVTTAPGDDRIFVAERPGTVQAVNPDGTVTPYLDLTAEVEYEESFEQGLLGIAMHPAFASNGRFFVYHSLPNDDTQLKEFVQSGDDASIADPASARVVLTVDKGPGQQRHNGGRLEFGPDGMLWMSVGDGFELEVHPQDPSTLLGSILRLDVDGDLPYATPTDNAFPNGGGHPAVWAYGLRNPWQFSLDEQSNRIWIGDVGHQVQEEINVWPIDRPGANFGWPIREGAKPGPRPGMDDGSDYVEPVLAIDRETDDACAIVAGPIYRGERIPGLQGRFLYGDWCVGWVRSLRLTDAGNATGIEDHSAGLDLVGPSSFSLDNDGEVLVSDFREGIVARLVPAGEP